VASAILCIDTPQSSSRSGLRSTATGLPSTRHSLQLVEESVEFSLADLRGAIIAAGWSQMVRRRILDAEQVMEHGPHIALGVPRLALTDVKDHDAGGALWFVGRLNGEGETKIALEMDSADDRSERARESVCTKLLRARVPTELVMNGSIPSPFTHELVYKLAHRARGDHLELGHFWDVRQSSGPNASVGAAETSRPLASARKPGP
jgi:hypothetical protein